MSGFAIRSAAIHEAGHAVISHALGCIVTEIEIHYGTDRQRWEGSYRHMLAETFDFFDTPFLRQKSAKVSVAGILAQAKYLASETVCQPIHFSKQNDIGAWVNLFRSRKQKDSLPGEIHVRFTLSSIDGQDQAQVVDGSFFGGADAGPFIQCLEEVGDIQPVQLIAATIELLDREANWLAVLRLAEALRSLPTKGENYQRKMSRDIILPLLNGVSV
jgi:hypothetical protein